MSVNTKVFSYFTSEHLKLIAEKEFISLDEKAKKNDCIEAVTKKATEVGLKKLFELYSKKQFKSALPIEEKFGKIGLRKRLILKMENEGVEKVLETFDITLLKESVEALDAQPISNKKSSLVQQIVELLQFIGAEIILNNLELSLLKEILEQMKLKSTSSKSSIVRAIASHKSITAKPQEKNPNFQRKRRISKKELHIKIFSNIIIRQKYKIIAEKKDSKYLVLNQYLLREFWHI